MPFVSLCAKAAPAQLHLPRRVLCKIGRAFDTRHARGRLDSRKPNGGVGRGGEGAEDRISSLYCKTVVREIVRATRSFVRVLFASLQWIQPEDATFAHKPSSMDRYGYVARGEHGERWKEIERLN